MIESRLVRFATESVVIVVSILLAFAVDAWWERRGEREDARAMVELLVRDLSETEERLAEYISIATTYRDHSLEAYRMLSSPGTLDEAAASEALARARGRRTLRIPRAAYTDLLSTGTLRLIEDVRLRDAIVRFYEVAERTEVIVDRNNAAFYDIGFSERVTLDGLFVPRVLEGNFVAEVNRGIAEVNGLLGADFVHPRDRIFTLPPDSREWHSLRNALLQWASNTTTHIQLARTRSQEAAALKEALVRALDAA